MGKSCINALFSMAMLNSQRVHTWSISINMSVIDKQQLYVYIHMY